GQLSRPLRPYFVSFADHIDVVIEPHFEPDNCFNKMPHTFYGYVFAVITVKRKRSVRIGFDPAPGMAINDLWLNGKKQNAKHWAYPKDPLFSERELGPIKQSTLDLTFPKGQHLICARLENIYGPGILTIGFGVELHPDVSVQGLDGKHDLSIIPHSPEEDPLNRKLSRAKTVADLDATGASFKHINSPLSDVDRTAYLAWETYTQDDSIIDDATNCLSDNAELSTVHTGAGDRFMIIDFGTEVVGALELNLTAEAGVEIVAGYMEKFIGLKEMNSVDTLWSGGSTASSYTTKKGAQSWQTFWGYGFRYLVLQFRGMTQDLQIQSCRVRSILYPMAGDAQFHCDDSLVNRIHDIGRRTIECCSMDTHVDCPGFEQVFWVHDAYPLHGYRIEDGNPEYVRDMIDMIASAPQWSRIPSSSWGFQPSKYYIECPITFGYFALSIEDYVMRTGDIASLNKLFPLLRKQMDSFLKLADDTGLIKAVKGWYFVAWGKFDWTYDGIMTASNA
ncbi:MAG: hypothetical protein MJH11_21850, partial [Lentisphaeria bacterium]|nr:hypothetical protein [Lentisphaeria bacterium]